MRMTRVQHLLSPHHPRMAGRGWTRNQEGAWSHPGRENAATGRYGASGCRLVTCMSSTTRAKQLQRERIRLRDGDACHYCGASGATDLDHVVPRTLGGLSNDENTVLTCPRCNLQKGTKSLDDFIRWRACQRVMEITAPAFQSVCRRAADLSVQNKSVEEQKTASAYGAVIAARLALLLGEWK